MSTFFSADLHLNHKTTVRSDGTRTGIMVYCPESRPFNDDIDAMNSAIINKFHERVKPGDECWVIGDLCMGPREKMAALVSRLTLGGNISVHLIYGNHDEEKKWPEYFAGGVKSINEDLVIEAQGKRIWMNHFPVDNSGDHRDYKRPEPYAAYDIAICGHVHNLWKSKGRCVNVGVDVWNLAPISVQELIAYHGSL